MPTDAQEFARTVLAAFAAAGRSTDSEVGRAGGPSTSTMTKLRAAADGRSDLAEPRSQTWQAIDSAADWAPGTARRVWRGGEPVTIPQQQVTGSVGDPEEDLVEFTIEGNFGVRAVVKGPVRDMDAMQEAVSKLIAGMQVEESNTRALP